MKIMQKIIIPSVCFDLDFWKILLNETMSNPIDMILKIGNQTFSGTVFKNMYFSLFIEKIKIT